VTIADLNLQLNINYPEVYDLNLSLYSPLGTFLPLVWWNANVFGANFENTTFDDQAAIPIGAGRAPYRGSYRPDGALSAVNGEGVVGTWELHIDAYPFSELFNSAGSPPGRSPSIRRAARTRPRCCQRRHVNTRRHTGDSCRPGQRYGPNNDPLTVTGVTQGTKGSVVINANNTVTYTPNANVNGTDTFQYTINDVQGGSDTATVTVTINPVNDAPAGANKTVITPVNTAYTFAAANFGFSDPNDSPANAFLAVRITTCPPSAASPWAARPSPPGSPSARPTSTSAGSSSPRRPPAGPYASFTFQVRDDGGVANGGTDLDPTPNTITIHVTAGNTPPVAVNDSYSTNEDTTLSIASPGVLANDSDLDGNPITAVLVSGPSHGTLTLNANGSFSYTPAANYNGSDTFTYKANDGRRTATSPRSHHRHAVNDPRWRATTYSTNEGDADDHRARRARQRQRRGRQPDHGRAGERTSARHADAERQRLLHLHAGRELQRRRQLHLRQGQATAPPTATSASP
jgi:hypothetical protein